MLKAVASTAGIVVRGGGAHWFGIRRTARPFSSSFLAPDKGVRGCLLHPRGYLVLVEIVHGCQLYAACGLAHPNRRHRRFRLHLRAAYEHQFHVTDESTGREAPASAHTVVRHPPLHCTLEVWQGIGSQSIDTFGDTALRLRQARDIGEHGLVAFGGLRGACLAGHGDQQLRASLALGIRLEGRLSHDVTKATRSVSNCSNCSPAPAVPVLPEASASSRACFEG